MELSTNSWYMATARSDQLIAAIRGECIASELIRRDTGDVLHAARGAHLRANVLQDSAREILSRE